MSPQRRTKKRKIMKIGNVTTALHASAHAAIISVTVRHFLDNKLQVTLNGVEEETGEEGGQAAVTGEAAITESASPNNCADDRVLLSSADRRTAAYIKLSAVIGDALSQGCLRPCRGTQRKRQMTSDHETDENWIW